MELRRHATLEKLLRRRGKGERRLRGLFHHAVPAAGSFGIGRCRRRAGRVADRTGALTDPHAGSERVHVVVAGRRRVAGLPLAPVRPARIGRPVLDTRVTCGARRIRYDAVAPFVVQWPGRRRPWRVNFHRDTSQKCRGIGARTTKNPRGISHGQRRSLRGITPSRPKGGALADEHTEADVDRVSGRCHRCSRVNRLNNGA